MTTTARSNKATTKTPEQLLEQIKEAEQLLTYYCNMQGTDNIKLKLNKGYIIYKQE